MKKQIFFVGVYLKQKVHFPPLGFTNYVYGFTEASDLKEAGENAKQYFATKFKTEVEATRPQIGDRRFADPSEIIKPFSKANKKQQNIFQILSPLENEQTTILPTTEQRIKSENTLAKFRKRSTFYFNRIFDKWKSYNSAGI